MVGGAVAGGRDNDAEPVLMLVIIDARCAVGGASACGGACAGGAGCAGGGASAGGGGR